MAHNESVTLEELIENIVNWEKEPAWVARGWHSIEEYTYGLYNREILADNLAIYSLNNTVSQNLLDRIKAADESFRSVTEESKLCVWHCGPMFQHFPDGTVKLIFDDYDPIKFWYYYRWQSNCPYKWRNNDIYSYQKEVYGMDFLGMSQEQLRDRAREISNQWIKDWEEIKAARGI